ncbi:hypothetical protein C1Y40_05639 [Mycobacterium talmoniae]|uniref:Uncharacterized protein n=1 Tax=Mycobacterium talmoniae TaxID=1858794 RepID=A0A2S8BC28_9MYCO|nr:hypothetical protein C1Y40_05639 [Mycobacterium talmoniae]
MSVDRITDPLWIATAAGADASATGETDNAGPAAHFMIWAVADAPTLIAEYRAWLTRCGSYHVTAHDLPDQARHDRAATTVIDADPVTDADAAIAVTRSFVATDDGDTTSSTHHVSYFAVRGLLLEATTTMDGGDVDLVARLAAQTVWKLHAL